MSMTRRRRNQRPPPPASQFGLEGRSVEVCARMCELVRAHVLVCVRESPGTRAMRVWVDRDMDACIFHIYVTSSVL